MHTTTALSGQGPFDGMFDDILGDAPSNVTETNASVALDLAQKGFVVFPICDWGDGDGWKPISKFPEEASNRAKTIRKWWAQWPNARVGLLTGSRNGITVLDVDVKNGKDGTESLTSIGLADVASITPYRIRTPSGGWHLIFQYAQGVKNTVGRIGVGLDVRNERAFVIAPGSYKDGKRYEIAGDPFDRMSDLPPVPAEILSRVAARDDVPSAPVAIQIASEWQRDWAEGKLKDHAEHVASASDGQRQATLNNAVLQCAGYAAHGAITEQQARDALSPAGLACGLSEREVASTFKHAWADGLKKPLALPDDCEDYFEDLDKTDPLPAVGGDADGWHIEAFNVAHDPDLSQDQLALDLGKSGLDRNGRYVAEMGGWILWDARAGRWQIATSMQHMRIVRDFIRAKAKLLTEWAEAKATGMNPKDAEQLVRAAKGQAKTMKQDAAIAAVERLARSNKASLSNPEKWDADDFLLGTPAGTVDLHTGAVKSAKRSDYITKQTTVAPGPEGEAPVAWLNFLSEVFPDDPAMLTFIQRLLGYSLTGSTKEQKFFMFIGTGRNGKGTLLNTFQSIIGDYAKGIPTTALLESRNPQHQQSLARLKGARLVRGAELPVGQVWNESLVKTLTGGDVITANLMRQNSFDFVPKFSLIVDGNTKPRIRTTDPAMKARMTLVPFNASFIGREDRSLPDRLKAEAGAILRWCIEGAVAWQREGLAIPETVTNASRDYLDDEDYMGRFISEQVQPKPDGKVSNSEMYERFTWWLREEGIQVPWTKISTTKALIERDIKYSASNGQRYFKGITLQAPGFDGVEDDLGDFDNA